MLGSLLNEFAGFTRKVLNMQLYQKESPTQMSSCEECESFKNSFFYRKPPVAVFCLFYGENNPGHFQFNSFNFYSWIVI